MDAEGLETDQGGSLPWYRTIAGVGGMLITCSLLMYVCFRSCAKRGIDTVGMSAATLQGSGSSGSGSTTTTSSSSSIIRDSGMMRTTPHSDPQEMQRRPVGRKEGYAHVSDVKGVSIADSQAWWDQEEENEV
ncbi:hypothetical protein ACSSS7_005622 [Eimeria intestinalis]